MKYTDIINKMSLKEKIELCSGKDFWHTKEYRQYEIPSIMVADGPHGLRKQVEGTDMIGLNNSLPATSFPTAASTSCSWDLKLLEEVGAAIAIEAKANGVGVVLGPGVNVKRNPLCGRNFEYFSEDPYLAGKLGAGFINGAQGEGVGTSVKHFAFNNQEYKRFGSDSIMDERTMREIYLAAFETAVKEGKPATVMCAYNKINGTHCSHSKMLLTDILRREWGYEGMVVTDWGAMADRIESFKAGCDLSMPGGSGYMEKAALRAVKSGVLSEEEINVCADRVLNMVFKASEAVTGEHSFQEEEHHALACKAAEQSAVLLKNQDGILPLGKDSKVAFIGYMAKKIRYQGSGSSHINPTKIVNVIDAMPGVSFAEGCLENGATNDGLLAAAVKTAREAEIAVVFAGLPDIYESEGFDREDMKMPEGHNKMIEAVAEANANTVIVLMCGGVVETPWIDKVKAVLYMGLPGQAGGQAVVNLLYGKANPCGKLAETWPVRYEHCISSSYYGKGYKDAHYREGIYVGYRYYDKSKAAVNFPFGYGLSYTKFRYSDLKVRDNIVSVTVTNTGDMEGAEVAQLYIAAPQQGIHRPIKELKDFNKVFLKPGEKREVFFELHHRCFAIWDKGWKVPAGTYEIMVGTSSREILLRALVEKEGEIIQIPSWQQGSWYEVPTGIPTKEQWERMLGHSVEETPIKKGYFTLDNTLGVTNSSKIFA